MQTVLKTDFPTDLNQLKQETDNTLGGLHSIKLEIYVDDA